MLEAASVIEQAGYRIFFAWDNLGQINKLTTLLDIKLSSPQLDPHVFHLYISHRPLAMFIATRPYDLVFYLSDGSIPLLGGKKNLIHLQVPFHHVGGRSPLTQLKLSFVDRLIVNSQFTKSRIDREFAADALVIYPPIQPIKAVKKNNLILSVGRFEPSQNVKRQDILIKAFRRLSSQLPSWRLALAGTSADNSWLTKLKALAKGLPIDFYSNVSYHDLCELYAVSQVYWHAAGYQVNEDTHPELTEHFGIAVAEAITAGCIPLVIPKGGQTEIIPNSRYHWHTITQLCSSTQLAAAGNLPAVSLPPSLFAPSFSLQIKRLLS